MSDWEPDYESCSLTELQDALAHVDGIKWPNRKSAIEAEIARRKSATQGLSPTGAVATNTIHWISGFWRRIGALMIDSIILGAVGLGLGLIFQAQFVQLGGWGRFVGFFIALSYFGILNSRVFGGQTVGKKLVGIRVVDGDNQSIALLRSFARYCVLGVPFFLNGAQFTNEAMTSFWMYPISLVIFGGLLSVVYLYIFNRITRQSLHDLAVGTYVVNAESEKADIGAFWRPHLMVVAALLLVGAFLPAFTSKLAQNDPFRDLLAAQSALTDHPSVSYAGVSSGRSTTTSTDDGTRTTTYLSARAILQSDNVSDTDLAEQLATILANSHSNSQQMDVIQVVLTHGYDIGIASSWTNYSHTFNPADLASQD